MTDNSYNQTKEPGPAQFDDEEQYREAHAAWMAQHRRAVNHHLIRMVLVTAALCLLLNLGKWVFDQFISR